MISNLWPLLVVGGVIESQVRRKSIRQKDRADEPDLQERGSGSDALARRCLQPAPVASQEQGYDAAEWRSRLVLNPI